MRCFILFRSLDLYILIRIRVAKSTYMVVGTYEHTQILGFQEYEPKSSMQ